MGNKRFLIKNLLMNLLLPFFYLNLKGNLMRRYIFILLLVFYYISNSQTIIWEQEYKFDFRPTSTNLVLVDSYGNIINIIESQFYSYFLKYNTSGEFLTKKELYSPLFVNKTGLRVPISLCQSGTGYKILGGTSTSPFWNVGERLLPIIINTNNDGDTTIIFKQYNTNLQSNYDTFGINKNGIFNNTVSVGNKFFNGSVKQWVETNKYESVGNYHIIICCYDSLGKMLWRKGYDSLGVGGESYSLFDIKATKFNTITLLFHQYIIDGKKWKTTRLKLLEIDFDGNIINKFTITQNDIKFVSKEVLKINSNTYCFLNEFLDSLSNNKNFFWITNKEGNVLKEVIIPHKGIKTYLEKLRLSNNEGIICLGNILIDKKNIDDYSDDIGKLYLFKMNKELEFKWEYESSPDTLSNFAYKDMIFSKGNEFIVTGYKNKYNYYIAKFKDSDSLVSNINEISNLQNFYIYPNPVFDLLSIVSYLKYSKIEIYSTIGLKVFETEFKEKIDVSNLLPGVYIVKLGNITQKFIKL